MLYCPNSTCQALNSEAEQFCQNCSTFLPRHYLWALGEVTCSPGTLLADRYLCQQSRIFLDTKPALLSNTYQELPDLLLPYLQLVSYPLHVPQVYDWLPASVAGTEIILLDHAPLYQARGAALQPLDIQSLEEASSAASETSSQIELLPSIAAKWERASALSQLNWLWQIANLWQPLSREKVASSLLEAENLRVDGTWVRLLELSFQPQPTLRDLGQFWSLLWLPSAQPEIAGFLARLCQEISQGKIHNAELLLAYLDEALVQLTQAQSRQLTIATLSDRGPTRQRNEDACYPQSGSPTATVDLAADRPADRSALVIVCDGIGGHQGGDVASRLAIASLEQQEKELDLKQLDPVSLSVALEKAVCVANDKISQQNDSEQRFERQRMGTTVVMALARRHELYVTHVGDSRVYLMTRRGCQQITLDDDVASREVRLGYSFYRQALHQPSSGSLVQALGMSASSMLYPTVQRLIPNEDCIFLLCSDGLSDNERVEEAWETDVLPLLERTDSASGSTGSIDLAALAQRLVDLGNKRNGYDNVTVGIIHYQITLNQPLPTLAELPLLSSVSLSVAAANAAANAATSSTASSITASETQPTALVSPAMPAPESKPAGRSLLPWLGLIVLLCGLAGLSVALLPILWRNSPSIRPATAPAPVPSASPVVPSAGAPLAVGSFIQLQAQPDDAALPKLISRPSESPSGSPTSPVAELGAESGAEQVLGSLVPGSVLEVIKQQNLSQQESWVELRVCSVPAEALGQLPNQPLDQPAGQLPAVPVLPSGQTGWIRAAEILPQSTAVSPPPELRQACM
jgi:protein phosphatase